MNVLEAIVEMTNTRVSTLILKFSGHIQVDFVADTNRRKSWGNESKPEEKSQGQNYSSSIGKMQNL